ncbi:MAG: DUF2177 family protein, partial [Rhizobiaceae bacterium]
MTRYIVAYFATMVVFFVIDIVWLTTIAKKLYENEIGPLLLDEFKMGYAAGFY